MAVRGARAASDTGDRQGGRCKFEAALSPVESRTGLASSTHIHVVMHLSGIPGRIEDENVERIRPNVPSI